MHPRRALFESVYEGRGTRRQERWRGEGVSGGCSYTQSFRTRPLNGAHDTNELCTPHLQRGTPDADAYTWWKEAPLTNEGILDDLRLLQRAGKIRPTASG